MIFNLWLLLSYLRRQKKICKLEFLVCIGNDLFLLKLVGTSNLLILILFSIVQLLNATDGEEYYLSWEYAVKRMDHYDIYWWSISGWNFWWLALVISVAILYDLATGLGSSGSCDNRFSVYLLVYVYPVQLHIMWFYYLWAKSVTYKWYTSMNDFKFPFEGYILPLIVFLFYNFLN